jgi:hypothetical protein
VIGTTAEAVRSTVARLGATGGSTSPASEEALRANPRGGRSRDVLSASRGSKLPKTTPMRQRTDVALSRVSRAEARKASWQAGSFLGAGAPRRSGPRRARPTPSTREGRCVARRLRNVVIAHRTRQASRRTVPRRSRTAEAVLGTQHYERVARPLESLISFSVSDTGTGSSVRSRSCPFLRARPRLNLPLPARDFAVYKLDSEMYRRRTFDRS